MCKKRNHINSQHLSCQRADHVWLNVIIRIVFCYYAVMHIQFCAGKGFWNDLVPQSHSQWQWLKKLSQYYRDSFCQWVDTRNEQFKDSVHESRGKKNDIYLEEKKVVITSLGL